MSVVEDKWWIRRSLQTPQPLQEAQLSGTFEAAYEIQSSVRCLVLAPSLCKGFLLKISCSVVRISLCPLCSDSSMQDTCQRRVRASLGGREQVLLFLLCLLANKCLQVYQNLILYSLSWLHTTQQHVYLRWGEHMATTHPQLQEATDP